MKIVVLARIFKQVMNINHREHNHQKAQKSFQDFKLKNR